MEVKMVFLATFGHETKEVEISPVNGAGGAGGTYHLYVNRYYWAAFKRTSVGWAVHLSNPDNMTTDDIQIIEELIEGLGG